jgi:hypothetical protein
MNCRCGSSGRVPVCKCKALSSNPGPTNKKGKKEKEIKSLQFGEKNKFHSIHR